MIYTVTCNPSLDYVVSVQGFQTGCTNRTQSEKLFAGGKGINVSLVLKNMGIESTALGFVAGFTGEEIVRRLEKIGVKNDFIWLEEGFSRINVKLKAMDDTEINGQGPQIDEEKTELLLRHLDGVGRGDVLFLSGSIPASMPDDTYERIMRRLDGTGAAVVVDATKALLMNVLKYRPFLIKPNHQELGEIFGVRLESREDVIPYGKKLQEAGAQNVLISLAGEGAVLIAADGELYSALAPEGKLINAVGVGDSMVAGFMAGWLSSGDYKYAFDMGLAAGSASAFSEELATGEEIAAVYSQMKR